MRSSLARTRCWTWVRSLLMLAVMRLRQNCLSVSVTRAHSKFKDSRGYKLRAFPCTFTHTYNHTHMQKHFWRKKASRNDNSVCVCVWVCVRARARAHRGIMKSVNVKGKSLFVTLNLEGNSTRQSTMSRYVSLSFKVKQFYTLFPPKVVVSFLSEVTGVPWLVYGEYSVDLLHLQQIREFISIRTHLLKFYAQAP